MGIFSFLKKKEEEKTAAHTENNLARLFKMNMEAIEYENKGQIEKAVDLYEKVISEDFDGNSPYDSLTTYYRSTNRIEDEIRVLEKAIWVFTYRVNPQRSDRLKKLNRFKDRLEKAQAIKSK